MFQNKHLLSAVNNLHNIHLYSIGNNVNENSKWWNRDYVVDTKVHVFS